MNLVKKWVTPARRSVDANVIKLSLIKHVYN
jgi:hypothetical protein